ncbi:MAG TPA: hypothetical protein VLD58_14895 [Gemmatimonadales bacterium]|nr:hypothetical protein [Gemmatimonadales bacterium]
MYRTITEIRRKNREAGQHFFDPATIRFFNSTIGRKIYGGRFFITGERFEDSPEFPRRYTIRIADDAGHIHDASEFQEFSSHDEAEARAEYLASKADTISVSRFDAPLIEDCIKPAGSRNWSEAPAEDRTDDGELIPPEQQAWNERHQDELNPESK